MYPKNRKKRVLFKDDIIQESERMAGFGLTDEQMSYIFDTTPATFSRWQKRYPFFKQALKRGVTKSNMQVVASLFKRAIGYKYKEITYERSRIIKKKTVTKVVIKEVIPDTTAQAIWLNNKMPDQWRRNRPETQITVNATAQANAVNVEDNAETRERLKNNMSVLERFGQFAE